MTCLGCGAGLLLFIFRLAERPDASTPDEQLGEREGDDDASWELV